ncbi:hypothetical protein ACFYT3_08555 [Nocardia amikacinitolerans]|uniref:hypothetical protein n=1 Tax=Nocardia amikacinitolerans TaxID=756689 RepID=UPI0036BDA7D1
MLSVPECTLARHEAHPAVNVPENEGGTAMSGGPWIERAIKPGTEQTTELYAYLPYEYGSNRYWLKGVLGKQARPTTVQRNGRTAWKTGRKHMLRLAAAMPDKYGEIELRLEVSKTMQCDTNCKNANPATVFDCVCACGGENHGGVGRYTDWYRAGRTTLLRNDETEVKQVIITRGQIPLPKQSTETPGHTIGPAAQVEPPRRPQPAPSPPPRPATSPPSPPSEPALRTVIPAANRFGDLGQGPADFAPRPAASPAPPAPEPVRRRRVGPLNAAVLALLALGAAIWLIAQPTHPAARQVTNQETVHPSSTTQSELPPAPPLSEAAPPPPPPEEPPAPQPRFPAGCYPFQPGC